MTEEQYHVKAKFEYEDGVTTVDVSAEGFNASIVVKFSNSDDETDAIAFLVGSLEQVLENVVAQMEVQS